MRFAVAALCVLALTGSASAFTAKDYARICDQYGKIPDKFRGTPEVEWSSFVLPRTTLQNYCKPPTGASSNACTYPIEAGTWAMFIADDLPPESVACVVQYEMAHMPPNYWGDPDMEAPVTMEYLTHMRRDWLRYERTR